MIDPNKTYRTRDGRPVRIYAVDGGGPNRVHGAVWDDEYGWLLQAWNISGKIGVSILDLVEVTLADELRDQIPWEALRTEIRWVAMDNAGDWYGFSDDEPICKTMGYWMRPGRGMVFSLSGVFMPNAHPRRWAETLIERPEGR